MAWCSAGGTSQPVLAIMASVIITCSDCLVHASPRSGDLLSQKPSTTMSLLACRRYQALSFLQSPCPSVGLSLRYHEKGILKTPSCRTRLPPSIASMTPRVLWSWSPVLRTATRTARRHTAEPAFAGEHEAVVAGRRPVFLKIVIS